MPESRVSSVSDLLSGNDRSVGDVMTVLGKDFDYLASKMEASSRRGTFTVKDATHARSLVRALFALVEGVTYALKITAYDCHVSYKRALPPGATEMALEHRYELSDTGEIVTRPAKITLDRNLKFAFQFYAATFSATNSLKTNTDWWQALKRCEKLRDRLMHPRRPDHLAVMPRDVVDAVKAERGFKQAVVELIQTSGQHRGGSTA